ncbi:MAG: type II secretion system F family protein, partial [bacterium]
HTTREGNSLLSLLNNQHRHARKSRVLLRYGALSRWFNRRYRLEVDTLINHPYQAMLAEFIVGYESVAPGCNQVINDVESGQQFSESLAKHPKVFNKIFVSLVAASETSGTLDKGLERLANQQEKDADITSKVRGAMIYPGIVLLVMIGVGSFMIIKVLPQVQSIYAGIPGASLPFVTRFLLAISNFVTKFWYLVVILLGLIGFLGTRWSRTIAGRDVIDGLKMKMWPIAPLFMKLYMARFARTGTTLIASGVPLIQMLQISGESIDNVHISRTLAAATEKVKGGKSLSEALSGSPDFLDLVPNMIRIGEQSGSMEVMMDKIATYYEKEVDNEIKAISTIIEPVMMIIMGIMAFTLVAAILLPIYGLTNQAGFNGR